MRKVFSTLLAVPFQNMNVVLNYASTYPLSSSDNRLSPMKRCLFIGLASQICVKFGIASKKDMRERNARAKD